MIPAEEVSTDKARAAMPAEVPVADAVANVAAVSQLVLGIERSDLALISRGLADRLHQPHRAPSLPPLHGVPRRGAGTSGAIGATISGAGPALLFWCFWQDTGKVTEALRERSRLGGDPPHPVQPPGRRRARAVTQGVGI